MINFKHENFDDLIFSIKLTRHKTNYVSHKLFIYKYDSSKISLNIWQSSTYQHYIFWWNESRLTLTLQLAVIWNARSIDVRIILLYRHTIYFINTLSLLFLQFQDEMS